MPSNLTVTLGDNGLPLVALGPDSTDRTDAATKPAPTEGRGVLAVPEREIDATNAAILQIAMGGGSTADLSAALSVERRAWLKASHDAAVGMLDLLCGEKKP